MLPRCAHAFWPFQGILTSAAGAFSRRARPRPRAMAGSRRRCSTWGACARPGGGGKKRVVGDPTLLADLLALMDPDARSDPMSPLLWTCRSLSQLARALTARGHRVGRTLVGELLRAQRFSLQANRKTREGEGHPDRDAQFRHVTRSVRPARAAGEPVISVDTKNNEPVGDFKNPGRGWRP